MTSEATSRRSCRLRRVDGRKFGGKTGIPADFFQNFFGALFGTRTAALMTSVGKVQCVSTRCALRSKLSVEFRRMSASASLGNPRKPLYYKDLHDSSVSDSSPVKFGARTVAQGSFVQCHGPNSSAQNVVARVPIDVFGRRRDVLRSNKYLYSCAGRIQICLHNAPIPRRKYQHDQGRAHRRGVRKSRSLKG